jgi:chromosome partitioning protein
MKAVLVANPKGGCGKTTLSVNIAGLLASQGECVALLDMDRQQSASLWIETRPESLPNISTLESRQDAGLPDDWLIVDSSAGMHGRDLAETLKLADKIIVPVSPSMFDLHASRDFLQALSEENKARRGKYDIGIVGMRMAPNTRASQALEYFLSTLDLPVLAYIRDTQVYVNAAFEGKSVFDLPRYIAERELEEWRSLQSWLTTH